MWRRCGLLFALLFVVGGALTLADWRRGLPADLRASYVGRAQCIACHQVEANQWAGSHHDLAMDRATPETVLGKFDGAELEKFGVTSTMFRRDGKYLVRTEGPDGQLAEFEVKYVFGVEPLQQYMVEFDRPADMPENQIARLQVLRLCWDTHRQRWFYLPPPDVRDEPLRPDDPLHWTGITMCWNNSCADCHSTHLQKGFDVATRTYHTTFSEIDVSCEACHGPGSIHVQLASRWSLFWDPHRGNGLVSLRGGSSDTEIHTCAHCHSRHQQVVASDFEGGTNFYDHFNHATLSDPLYHADGQILDEVYEHGSFLQSKMYHKGIRCSDCHDPHSLRLKHTGNQVCTSCHQHPAGKYDGRRHHQHPDHSPGARCVDCHMPPTTYMEVDPRRDHSFRVPRPDLSVKLGTPNACSQCHLALDPPDDALGPGNHPDTDRPVRPERLRDADYATWIRQASQSDAEARDYLSHLDRWAAAQCAQWYGSRPDTDTHFANALYLARRGDLAAQPQLLELVANKKTPAIVRATALSELIQFDSAEVSAALIEALGDSSPVVRQAAIAGLGSASNLDRNARADLFGPLLTDSTRLVRTEAARVLAGLSAQELRGAERSALETATAEYERALAANNDRGGAHAALGLLRESQGQTAAAIWAYETAIRIEPNLPGPRANLAGVLERLGPSADAQGSSRSPPIADDSKLRISQLRAEELTLAARYAEQAPRHADVQYRYGLTLYVAGRIDEAHTAIVRACELDPKNPLFQLALVRLEEHRGRFDEAARGARRLLELRPQNAAYRALLNELMNRSRQPLN